MIQIRTLTTSKVEIIHVPDDQIGVPRYGTKYAEPSRPADHSVAPSASMAMANRAPAIPEDQLLGLPGVMPAKGLRRYDRQLDCWVTPPKPPIPVETREPGFSVQPYNDTDGHFYWIIDRETGMRQRRICAQTPARAQQIAAEYALNHYLPASAAYAVECNDD